VTLIMKLAIHAARRGLAAAALLLPFGVTEGALPGGMWAISPHGRNFHNAIESTVCRPGCRSSTTLIDRWICTFSLRGRNAKGMLNGRLRASRGARRQKHSAVKGECQ
jgi:hypothetical protein